MSSESRCVTIPGGAAGKRWLLSLTALLATTTAAAAAEERGVEIVFGGVQCYKTTSGAGDDQPYAAMVAADLRTGKVTSASHSFGDVGEDQLHQTSISVGDFSPLKLPDDIVLLVAFAEHDTGGSTSFDGSGVPGMLLAETVRQKAVAIVKKYQAQYSSNLQWRPQVEAELRQALGNACSATLGIDDLIGTEVVRLQAEDVSGPKERSVERRVVLQGDGGAYVLYFDIKSRDAMFGLNPPGGGSGIPGVPLLPSLSGKWASNLGPTELTQKGDSVTGLVNFPNKVVGKVDGKISGMTLDGHWFVHAGHQGSYKLTISGDGQVLSGSYQSSTDPNFQGPWKLTRTAMKPPAPKIPDVVGNWQQLPGSSGLPKVTVIIGQQAAQPTHFACRIPDMKLFGKGKIAADLSVTASFGAPNSDMSDFGPGGPISQASGKITKVDAAGRALRIEWQNGVVYERQ